MHKRFQIHSMQPANPPKGWRKRYGYFGIDWETDAIFLPGELFGNPTALFLCASFDGEPLYLSSAASGLNSNAPRVSTILSLLKAKSVKIFLAPASITENQPHPPKNPSFRLRRARL
jgi:hypothetical protein